MKSQAEAQAKEQRLREERLREEQVMVEREKESQRGKERLDVAANATQLQKTIRACEREMQKMNRQAKAQAWEQREHKRRLRRRLSRRISRPRLYYEASVASLPLG